MVRDKDQQMEASIYLDHDPVNNMEPATKDMLMLFVLHKL